MRFSLDMPSSSTSFSTSSTSETTCPSPTTPGELHTIRLLGECVFNGGYDVASVILSFLSPPHLPNPNHPNQVEIKI